MRSAGGISSLVARCHRELPKDAALRELVEICRKRMRRRQPPFAFPRLDPPITAPLSPVTVALETVTSERCAP